MAIALGIDRPNGFTCKAHIAGHRGRLPGEVLPQRHASFSLRKHSALDSRVASAACASSARQLPGRAVVSASGSSRMRTAAAADGAASTANGVGLLAYQHIMLALADPSPYFGDGSKQAISMAGGLAAQHEGKVTVLMLDEKPMGPEDGVRRMEVLATCMNEAGCHDYTVMDQVGPACNSATIGDVADEVEATLLVMSTEAVHSKRVDSNLMAEFVPCPMLLLP